MFILLCRMSAPKEIISITSSFLAAEEQHLSEWIINNSWNALFSSCLFWKPYWIWSILNLGIDSGRSIFIVCKEVTLFFSLVVTDIKAHSALCIFIPLTILLLLFGNNRYRCSGCCIQDIFFNCSYNSGYLLVLDVFLYKH